MPVAIVHYHEVALKSGIGGFFEQRLANQIRSGLKNFGVTRVDPLPGRIRLSFPDDTQWETVRNQLTRTFGITNFSLAHPVPIDYSSPDLTQLKEAIGRDLPAHPFKPSGFQQNGRKNVFQNLDGH